MLIAMEALERETSCTVRDLHAEALTSFLVTCVHLVHQTHKDKYSEHHFDLLYSK